MNKALDYQHEPWNAHVDLAAGDATKVIKAAPGAGKKLVVTAWYYMSVTSAAQLMTIGDGTIVVGRLPVSIAAGVKHELRMDVGVTLTSNTALSITPAAAGPAGLVIVEGCIVNG